MLLQDEIQKLKAEKKAVILAHYYVSDEVKEIADHVGDSYYLSKTAAGTEAERIILCGVSFMAESAKLLNPNKRVFMPDASADCPMAHMARKNNVLRMREEHEDLAVVCYINSTAEIKACSDVCVTSANAVKIVKRLPNRNLFFIPDGNLGAYVAKQVPEKNMILNEGFCPIHAAITYEEVLAAKKAHPQAKFAAHPECTCEVLEEADYIGSTSGMIRYVTESTSKEFIIGTETGVFYEIKGKNPDKLFYPVNERQICTNMKKVTLEKVLEVLQKENNEIFVEEELRLAAMRPLKRMLELGE
ncbi:MAG: quinolinate synthase NadA [Lachnospiraceae bacterium]